MKRLLTILFFFLCSCELVVDIDVPFEGEQMVINSFVCPDSLWSASISLNRHILSTGSSFMSVGTATVTVYDETGAAITLQHVSSGNYKSQTEKPLTGKQYTIHVSEPNYPFVEGKVVIPTPAVITSVGVENVIRDGDLKEVTTVKFKDNGTTKDFYHIRLEVEADEFDYYTGEITSLRYPYPQISSDNPQLNAQFISVDAGLLVKDVLFNGKETEVRIKLENGYYPSYFAGMRVVLRSISKEYYDYMATKKLQDETSGHPFAQPVNVTNNISNGFGIFAGLSNSAFDYDNPRPVITEIFPASGKVGDVITIIGQNFVGNYYSNMIVRFKGLNGDWPWANVIEVTDTQLKVVVPNEAINGKIVLFRNASCTLSDMEFQIIN